MPARNGRVARLIAAQRGAILQRWTEHAQRSARGRGISRPELQDIVPAYLESLAALGEETRPARRRLVDSHLAALRQGLRLAEMVEELLLLGTCIASTCEAVPRQDRPEASELQPILRELQETAAAVTERFTQFLHEDQQAEKMYLRRLQAIATTAHGQAHGDVPPLRARLGEVLRVVLDAVRVDDGRLLLADDGGRLVVGAAAGVLAGTEAGFAPDAFAARIAAGGPASSVIEDVRASRLPFVSALSARGLRSLLGVRLPVYGEPLVGVLYVGRAGEQFTVQDARRLEVLTDVLAVHLENAALYAALRERIAGYESERQLRETFVSVLAHDLRGPLSIARIGAALLMKAPERLDERHDLAARIVTAVDRTDAMVRDLLDANRIRAGEPLTLQLGPCDLADVVRDAVVELTSTYGDRFELRGEESIVGTWSEHQLRRVATNLGSNAAKYGDAGTPVVFELARTERGARFSVHNQGPPLEPEILADPFRPFARAPAAEASGERGWGLGLTLVKGAVEAHGGSIRIDSAPGQGTTFIIELPMDARPFQSGEGATRAVRPA